jgi:hypothetical protein
MSLIRQTSGDMAAEIRFFHRCILPLSTVLPGLLLLVGKGQPYLVQSMALMAAGSMLALMGLAIPGIIRPLWQLAQWISFGIGWTVSVVLLLILFFGVMMPVGLTLRLFRRHSPVTLGPDATLATYWESSPAATTEESAFRQF